MQDISIQVHIVEALVRIPFASRIAMLDKYATSDEAFEKGIYSAFIREEPSRGKVLTARVSPSFGSHQSKNAMLKLVTAMKLPPSALCNMTRCLDHGKLILTASVICQD